MRPMRIKIKNFKTVKEANLELGKVTVLLGPPSSGKSNVLEALALLGYPYRLKLRELYKSPSNVKPTLHDIIRLESVEDIFYFREKGRKILIKALPLRSKVSTIKEHSTGKEVATVEIYFEKGNPVAKVNNVAAKIIIESLSYSYISEWPQLLELALDARLYGYDRYALTQKLPDVLKYSPTHEVSDILFEDSSNIVSVLNAYERILWTINEWFESLDIRIDLRLLRDGKVVVFDYVKEMPLRLLSDTVGRILYYITALYTCIQYVKAYGLRDRLILMLEEPEAHVFPYSFQLLVNLIKEASKEMFVVLTSHNGSFVSHLWDRVKDVKTYYTYRDKRGSTKIVEVSIGKLAKDLITGSELLVLTPKEVHEKYTVETAVKTEK